MSCPAWGRLVERRDAGEESGWRAALEHFDRCSKCREEALAADPTLLFRRLPSTEVDARDVEEIREKVSWLRRARELERSVEDGDSRSPTWRWLGRIAATILLVAASTGIGLDRMDPPGLGSETVSGSVSPPEIRLPPAIAAQPLLEDTGPGTDQIVEWTDAELSLVVLIDEELDV